LLVSTSLTELAFGEKTEHVNHYDCGDYGNMIVEFGNSLVSFQGLTLDLIESQENEYLAELDSLGVEAQLTLDGVSSDVYFINKAISFVFVTKQVDDNKVTTRDEVIESYCGLKKQYRTNRSLGEYFQLYTWQDYAYFDCKISFETELFFPPRSHLIRGEHIRTVVTHSDTRDYYIQNDEPRKTYSRLWFRLPRDNAFGPNTKFGLNGSFTIDTYLNDFNVENSSDSEKYEYVSDSLGIRQEIFIDKQSGDLKGLYIDEALGFIQEYSEFNGACQEILAPVLCEESCSYVEESGYRYPM